MLALFGDEFPSLLQNISDAIATNDTRAVHDAAHAAKGAAATAAATPMVHVLQQLETDARTADWQALRERLDLLKVELHRFEAFRESRTVNT